MSKDKIEVNMNVYDIPILVEALEEANKEIERLNKKIEQYENPEDMTLMFMWCDEKAKDEIKRLNNIIKNQQEDIEEYIDKLNEVVKERNKYLHIINELERYINGEYIYDELGMKIFDASELQDKLQELKGSDKE